MAPTAVADAMLAMDCTGSDAARVDDVDREDGVGPDVPTSLFPLK